MKVRLYSKNIDISAPMSNLITQKLVAPVNRLLSDIDAKMNVPFDIEIGKRSVRDADIQWFCEVNIAVPGEHLPLRVRVSRASFDAAVNGVKDTIEQRVKRFKGKRKAEILRGARKFKSHFRS